MKPYQTFTFAAYEFDRAALQVKLHYHLDDDIHFTETLTLPPDGLCLEGVYPELLDRLLFMLHLAGGVSYYKTCLPPTIKVESGQLTKEQAHFWNQVYQNGLGEFCYQNQLNFPPSVNFPAELSQAPEPLAITTRHQRVLVPMGGGKDSLVSSELIKAAGLAQVMLRVGPHPLIEQAAAIAKVPLLNIDRQLDPQLFALNKAGALNGHVPITAYLSSISTLVALLYGFDFIAFSNEGSANEGNLTYQGQTINHQWSKSLDFEQMFQDYLARYLTLDLDYFSLLRSMNELQIANLFAIHPKYFACFTSCNANWKILTKNPTADTRWQAEPKTAFVFALLAAFLGKDDLLTIFGQNFFESETLLPIYRQLLGLEGFKPFECVGTAEETTVAFALALQKNELTETAAMQMFLAEKAPNIKDLNQLIEATLDANYPHLIPSRFLKLLDDH